MFENIEKVHLENVPLYVYVYDSDAINSNRSGMPQLIKLQLYTRQEFNSQRFVKISIKNNQFSLFLL